MGLHILLMKYTIKKAHMFYTQKAGRLLISGRLNGLLIFASTFFAPATFGQQARQVNQQFQTWTSVNSIMRFSNRWGMMADMHMRRNNGVADPSFFIVRVGADYWVHDKMIAAAGYGHMWLAPTHQNWSTTVHEHRLHQQIAFSSAAGTTGIVNRIRNEQRWMQQVKEDKRTGYWKFTNRVRYLVHFSFPIAASHGKYAIVLADEIFVHFGKDIVYNTFDQNRLFIGIKSKINKNWSYDIGYMNVYQQKASGYQYDLNHTFRWFFYYTPDFRSKHKEQLHASVAHLD
jgi:hypothetical protein